jgi:hypothetical protein
MSSADVGRKRRCVKPHQLRNRQQWYAGDDQPVKQGISTGSALFQLLRTTPAGRQSKKCGLVGAIGFESKNKRIFNDMQVSG